MSTQALVKSRGNPISRAFAALLVWSLHKAGGGGRRALAQFAGALAYGLGIRRKLTLSNLAHAFPELSEDERRRIAKGAYANMARAALEALASTEIPREELDKRVKVANWGPLEAAIKAGQAGGVGVVVATAHFGSWELLAEVMANRGFKLNAVVRPLKGALNARIIEAREKAGLGLIAPRGAIAGSVEAVRRGEVVAMLIDQALPQPSAIWVPFFGRPASTSPSLAVAAQRTGAPVFVVMGAREGDDLTMYCEGPFHLPEGKDSADALAALTAEATGVVEKYVRRFPDQWMWLHRRWKGTPPTTKNEGPATGAGPSER